MHRFRLSNRLVILVLVAITFVIGACVPSSEISPNFSHQGRLLDENGNPVPDGNYTIEYKIYNVPTGGTAEYTETKSIPVKDGLFTTSLGLISTITPTIFALPTWLEVSVDGENLTPRQPLQGAPFAFSLTSGAVVQGKELLDRTYSGQENTGAALAVWNTDTSVDGGHGLLALTSANTNLAAALQARGITNSYGAIITSESYRALRTDANNTAYYSASFNGGIGIYVEGSCTGCTMAYMAENAGSAPINAGDFVAVVGVVVDPDFNIPIMQVRKATSPGDAVIGVATSAMTRSPASEVNGITHGGYDAASGPAAAGGYLTVAVQGLVQANAADASLAPGATLTAGTDGAVQSSAGTFRAMSEVDGNGKVWVMLSGQ